MLFPLDGSATERSNRAEAEARARRGIWQQEVAKSLVFNVPMVVADPVTLVYFAVVLSVVVAMMVYCMTNYGACCSGRSRRAEQN